MALNERICRLRTNAQLSQEAFADIFHVSRQSVQKWENGSATPELSKIIDMARYFDVSLDQLVLGMDKRAVECMEYGKIPRPQYANMPEWELYVSDILIEYQQSIEEGLDISAYQELFRAVSALPAGDIKKQLGDVLFDIVRYAHPAADYAYQEPSELYAIRALRKWTPLTLDTAPLPLEKKIAGAWMGRICGCMLGKSLESIRTNELIPFLKETDNYPMHRYVYKSEITDDRCKRYPYFNTNHICVDETDGMPVDDDTNYIVLAQQLIENYGKDFTPDDVSLTWLQYQSKNAYCTAERVAFCNFVKGYKPPQSAVYQNPYREWIGAQIRGDYFGYINPGDPELAAEMEEDRAAGSWGAVADMDNSILGKIGNPVSVVFKPLGFGNMPSTVATVMGLVAKEEVVGVLGVLYGADDAADVVDDEDMTAEEKAEALSPIATAFNESSNGHGRLAAYAFMIFNLLCAPCFAAIGAMKREFNNAKWTLAAVGYQCAFAYIVALIVYQLGLLFNGAGFTVATAIAILLLAGLVYLVVRKNPYNDNHLTQKVSA